MKRFYSPIRNATTKAFAEGRNLAKWVNKHPIKKQILGDFQYKFKGQVKLLISGM